MLKGTHFVFLEPGRRRSARQSEDDTIVLDAAPTRRASFLAAIATSVGRASPAIPQEEIYDEQGAVVAMSGEEAERLGQLILVAEDNVTNQEVIRRQLNRLGYAADIVADGVEAMEALKSKHYALLLTDCHMPNLDGYELAGKIRTQEDPLDDRLAIIAITANALEGEVERCLEAGMDDYLPKPLEMAELRQVLKKWMPVSALDDPMVDEDGVPAGLMPTAASVDADGPSSPADTDAGRTLDPNALKAMFDDDEETIREILKEFVPPSADNVQEIVVQFELGNAEELGAGAHKLKSSARAVGAHRLADLCEILEAAGGSADWAEINRAVPQLAGALEAVAREIDKL